MVILLLEDFKLSKPMDLRGAISVADMGIDKATILNFVFHVSELDGVVTVSYTHLDVYKRQGS